MVWYAILAQVSARYFDLLHADVQCRALWKQLPRPLLLATVWRVRVYHCFCRAGPAGRCLQFAAVVSLG